MRILQRANTITFVSLSARSFVLIAALLPSAGATTITILPAINIGQATAETNAWLTQTFGAGTMPNRVQVDVDTSPGKNRGVIKLELLTSFNSLYFFITGLEGNVEIQTADGTTARIHDGDDGLYFVGITSARAIGSIQWQSHDSFVLKDFGTPKRPADAPEPLSWLFVSTGLAAIRRRCRAPSAPSPALLWTWRSVKLVRLLRSGLGRGSRARS